MKTDDVLDYFDNDQYRVAELLGITRQAVEAWGWRVPELSARKLHEITKGKLAFDAAMYRKARRP